MLVLKDSTVPFNRGGKRRETGLESIIQVIDGNFYLPFIHVHLDFGKQQCCERSFASAWRLFGG